MAILKPSTIFFTSAFLLFSCQETKEPYISSPASDSGQVVVKSPTRFFSGTPDIPKHDREITSAGIGKILLGDKIENLPANYDSVNSITVYEDGIQWPGVKIYFPNKTWLIAEAVNTVKSITHLRTNNPEFKTAEGYYAGMKINTIYSTDSIRIHPNHKAFEFSNTGIYFKIVPVKEKKFFRKNSYNFNILENAFIEEIFIICGDC